MISYTLLRFVCRAPLAFIAILLGGCCNQGDPTETNVRRVSEPMRLVSSTPSTTEILFDIGLGDRIVGDSPFTMYPPEAKKIEKIGGLYDKNREKIASLKPDLIVCLVDETDFRRQMNQLGIEVLPVDHRSLEGVYRSYEQIGERFGGDIRKKATEQRNRFRERMDTLSHRSVGKKNVRVMLCIDRPHGTGRVQNLFIAGKDPFYGDLIRLAGGENVGAIAEQAFPSVSYEGMIELSPEVVVELMTGEGTVSSTEMSDEEKDRRVQAALSDWEPLRGVLPAVAAGRVHVITEDYATIPGPRLALFVERLYEILHPTEE